MSQFSNPYPYEPVQVPTPPKPARKMVAPLVIGAVVLALLVGVGAALVGYNRGVATSNDFYAAQPTPTVTVTKSATVTESTTVTATTTVTREPEKAATYTLTGMMEITGSDNWTVAADGGCEGSFGYNDLNQGTPITVYSGDTTFAGAGFLGAGVIAGSTCVFSVDIADIAGGSNVYLVEVSHRGKLKAELIGELLYFGATIGD